MATTTEFVNSERLYADRKACMQEKVAQRAAEKGVLLVRVRDLPTSGGVLSERQKRWLDAAPYDSSTENPVLYRHSVEAAKTPSQVTERETARLEVQSLPDKPAASQGVSGVAERIRRSRRERHDKTIEDMRHELAIINSELEPRIQEASQLVKSRLEESDKGITAIFARISSDKFLQSYSLAQLKALWGEVARQSPLRRGNIRELDATLSGVEEDRAGMVTEVLKSYGQLLQAVAYLLPEDVHRLVEGEAHSINLSILANRRNYAKLCMHLMNADFMREREQHQKWEAAVADWRELQRRITLEDFHGYMESEAVCSPPELEKLRGFLSAEQGGVNRRREGLLQQLGSMRPPTATKTAVYEWMENVSDLHKQLAHIHSSYLLQMQGCLETVTSACQEKMEACREHLVSAGVYDSSTVYEVMNEDFLPLIAQHAAKTREQLQNTERSLELLLSSQQSQFQALFQLAQGAAHTWDTHTTSYSQLETSFQESLRKCRALHDGHNQNLEANLDVLLDRLRQGASQEVLKQYLEEVLRMLDTIKEGYESFHSVLLREAQQWPSMAQRELDSYDTALCNFLGVNRTAKKKKSKAPHSRVHSDLSPAPSRTDSRSGGGGAGGGGGGRKTKTGGKSRLFRTGSVAPEQPSTLPAIVEELVTSQGTSFYLHTTPDHTPSAPGTFLTQDEESEGAILTSAMEGIAIPEKAFAEARKGLRVSFLDHLEQWRTEMGRQVADDVAGKEEEAHTELELRLHLHEPRPSRVEQDIHNVRAAELVAHRDRVSRHAQGVVAAVKEQKGLVQNLQEELQEQSWKFSKDMEPLETALSTASKMSGLLKIKAQAQEMLEKHVQSLSDVAGRHQSSSEVTIAALAASNTSFRTSLRLFSEGGNYCHEEIEVFSKKLDKLTTKLAAAQAFISGEVEVLSRLHRTATEETTAKFQAQLQLHDMDLSFLEGVSRVLTHTQVRVKSEVAASNVRARELGRGIVQLGEGLEACSNPGPDTQPVEIQTLLDSLPALFEACSSRMTYLHCKASVYRGARVGFHKEVTSMPISAVNGAKSIQEYTSAKKKLGFEVEATGGRQTIPGSSCSMVSAQEEQQKKSGRQSRKKQPAVERKNVTFGIGGGEDGSDCFLPKIRTILKGSHKELYNMAELFYQRKGPRPVTRPQEMKETFEACMDTLIERTQAYRQQAEDYRNDCIEEFRSQLESLLLLLVRIPQLVFGRAWQKHQGGVREDRERLTEAHRKWAEAMAAEKSAIEASLRPSLGHPSQQEQLERLCAKEQERHDRSLGHIQSHAHSLREVECSHAKVFIRELVAATTSLLSLFDSVIPTSEVIPGSGRLKAKPPVEQLLRQHIRPDHTAQEEESRPAQPPVTAGKGTWPGLPESELKALWEAVCPQSDVAEAKKRLLIDGEGRSPTEEVSSKRSTIAHEAVVRSRDKVFQECVSSSRAELEGVSRWEGEERTSEERWDSSLRTAAEKIKKLYT